MKPPQATTVLKLPSSISVSAAYFMNWSEALAGSPVPTCDNGYHVAPVYRFARRGDKGDVCQLGLYRLRFIGFQDLFTISRETQFFFIETYGLSTVVMCYVGGKYVYIDVEGTSHRQGLLYIYIYIYLRICATSIIGV